MILAKQPHTEDALQTLRADASAQPKDIAQLEKTLANTQASTASLKTKLEAAQLSQTEACQALETKEEQFKKDISSPTPRGHTSDA